MTKKATVETTYTDAKGCRKFRTQQVEWEDGRGVEYHFIPAGPRTFPQHRIFIRDAHYKGAVVPKLITRFIES